MYRNALYAETPFSVIIHKHQKYEMSESKQKCSCLFVFLVFVTYATIILFGVIENLKGVTFALIKDTFGITYDFQGYLVSISWYGYVIFCLVSTFVIEKFGIKAGLLCGYAFILSGCLVTAFAPNFISVVISLMVIWMGFGCWEVGYNDLAQRIFTKNSAIYIGIMHFNYGLGSILGPQVARWLLQLGGDSYRGIYKLIAIPTVILLILNAVSPFKLFFHEEEAVNEAEEKKEKLTVVGALKMPYVWLCSLTLGFMEVIEFSAANWGGLYFRDVYGLSVEKEGATFVSMFYVLFALTRLISGFVIEKLGYYTSLFASLVIVVVIYIIGFLSGKAGIWILPFTGYFIGMMFPTYMCLLMQVFKENTSLISSVVIFLSGATNGVVQLLIGYINEFIGNAWGYRATVVYTLIPLCLLAVVYFNDDEMKKNKSKNNHKSKSLPITKDQSVIELSVVSTSTTESSISTSSTSIPPETTSSSTTTTSTPSIEIPALAST